MGKGLDNIIKRIEEFIWLIIKGIYCALNR